MKVVIALLITLALTSAYPLYKQCDSQWGSITLGGGPDTICKSGCAMSSLAMALAGKNKAIGGVTATPKTLNAWLKSNGGFSGELLVWGASNNVGLKYAGKVTKSEVASNFDSGKVVILNVRNGGHWVLMTGRSGSTFSVNDPGYSVSSYSESDVTQAAVYSVTAGFLQETLEHMRNFDADLANDTQ